MYKIINSSIKFKDIRYYPFKNIENIAKRLFKKKIHFTIIFKNNKEFKYTIKNKKNIDSDIIPPVNKNFKINLDIISTEITDFNKKYITEDIPNDLIKIKHIDDDDLNLFLDNFKEKLTDKDYDIKND